MPHCMCSIHAPREIICVVDNLITRTRPKEGSSFEGIALDGHGDVYDVSCRADILEDTHDHSVGLGEFSPRISTPLQASLGTTCSRHIGTSEHISFTAQRTKRKPTIHRYCDSRVWFSWSLSDVCLVLGCHAAMLHCRD